MPGSRNLHQYEELTPSSTPSLHGSSSPRASASRTLPPFASHFPGHRRRQSGARRFGDRQSPRGATPPPCAIPSRRIRHAFAARSPSFCHTA